MIAKLSGIVDEIYDDYIILDVNGVGYKVFVTTSLQRTLNMKEKLSLKIQHIFKESDQYLCGFLNEEELTTFKILLDVPGVGIKTALNILATISIEELNNSIYNQDISLFGKIKGIGKRTAERIILELKGKNISQPTTNNSNVNEAILALVSLGYQKNAIYKVINEVIKKIGQDASVNNLIVQSLKLL